MLIAIPQFQGTVSGAYELSRQISLHRMDFQNKTTHDEGLFDFPGVKDSFAWLSARGVNAILVGTIDPDNADLLADAGTSVFTGADDLDPEENVQRFLVLMGEALARRAKATSGGCCGGGSCAEEGPAHEHASEGGCCGGAEDAPDHDCCHGAGHDDPDHVCGCR